MSGGTSFDNQATEPVIKNDTGFSGQALEAVMATGAAFLIRDKHIAAASILANATGELRHWNHDNWNGGQDTWMLTLTIPAQAYFELENREEIEKQIAEALTTAMEPMSDSDFFEVRVRAVLDRDPEWRRKVAQHLSGEGITNQGRVRSDNIAAREHDGLRFRSLAEVHFYHAMKATGIPFAPLAVVLKGGYQYKRIEPDFLIFRYGVVMEVEIDGDLFHTETPTAADVRMRMLIDEGVDHMRIEAAECDTPAKAKEAVASVLATIEKRKKSRM